MVANYRRFACTQCGKCCNRSPEVELSEAAALADVFVFRLMFRLYFLPRRLGDYLRTAGGPAATAEVFYQRKRLLGAYALEYLMIGLATAVFGVIAGSIAAWLIVTRLLTLSFIWQAGSAAGVVAAALIVTVGLGLAGTLLALNQKPASVLRNL